VAKRWVLRPAGSTWGDWGDDDELGRINLLTPDKVLQGVREERAFLIRLAHNAAIDLMRRRATRDRTRENFAVEMTSAFAPTDDPDEAAFRNELSAALAELPPDSYTSKW